MQEVSCREIAEMIDHSLLRPNLTDDDIVKGCEIAKKYNVASVCVRPSDVTRAKELLKDSDVLVTTVIGFPHGAHTTATKLFEAEEAIKNGAVEIDMVLNIGKLLSHDYDYIEREIKAIVEMAHARGVVVKVILENCYLTDELKVMACQICERAGADYVKTSTGFGPGGATIPDIELMRRSVSPKVKIKAAGGVRTLEAAIQVRAAGCTRFGATATEAIMEECLRREAEGGPRASEPDR
ncbi:MAG: deoxyribose-phosphate aldolase [Firmicutes bacterium]|nr:deoxyribose-phosphate aldolase [Bacillota bacterium]